MSTGTTGVLLAPGASLRRHVFDVAIVVIALAVLLCAGLVDFERSPLPGDLLGMTPLAGPTRYSLDTVVRDGSPSVVVAGGPATVTVERGGRTTFGGWAVDGPAGRPADAVYVLLDGRPETSCLTRILRPDVATALATTAYGTSGFSCTIEANAIRPGRHAIALDIVVTGRRAYYTVEPKTLLVVR